MFESYKGKRVFVTGHTGFKGSWLCEMLLMAGAEVYGYALKPPTRPSLFAQLKLAKRIKSHVIGDVRDLKSLTAAVRAARPDLVFHLAAQPLVRESYRSPVETFDTNVMGTVNVLEAVRRVFLSTNFTNSTNCGKRQSGQGNSCNSCNSWTRNGLAQYLEANKIQTRNLFAGNILKHPCFESLKEGVDYRVAGTLDNTETIMNATFWIGLYPGMGEAKIDYMIKTIREFCGK